MNYYQQPFMCGGMPQMIYPQAIQQPQPMPGVLFPDQLQPGMIPSPPNQSPLMEQSYIENILRLNIGKIATVYMNFEGSQWGSKVFKGYVLAAGKDHLILQDQNSELRYVLLTIYLNYFTFDEEIEYDYPFRGKKKNK